MKNNLSEPTVYWYYVVNIRFLKTFSKYKFPMKYWFSIQNSSPDDDLDISIFTWYNFFLFEIRVLREIPYITRMLGGSGRQLWNDIIFCI